MKKNFKRTLAKVMAVAMTVALVGTAPEADAAKKIKLSNKSITVTKGKTKKVTIKNVKAKKVKKLTVKSSKKKIATVKKAGKTAFKVTGKKKGTAKVTVKVTVKGKKKATKLTLTVKVKNAEKKDTTKTTAAPVVNNATPTPAVNNATPTPAADATKAPEGTATQAPGGDVTTPVPGGDTTPVPATPVPGGDTTPVPATPVPVETLSIENVQLGGVDASKITYFNVENGVVDMILNENAQYGNVFSYFDVVLPEGASVTDIKKITYDIEGVTGDLSNKWNALLVGSPVADDPAAFPIDSYINFSWDGEGSFVNVQELYRSVTYGSSFNGGTVSEEAVLDEDDYTYIEDLGITGNTLRFSIFANLAGQPTQYKISNIKVFTTDGVVATEGFDAPGDTVDATLTAVPEGVVSLGKGTIAVGETTSAEFALTNSVLVGDATNVEWSLASEEGVISLDVDEEDATKAEITALKAGTETISVEVTTAKDKVATIEKVITVTEEAVEIEDIVLELTENNVITIASGTSQYSGGGTVDISELIAGVDLSNYENITVYANIMYNGEPLETDGVSFLKLLNSDNWNNGLVTGWNPKDSVYSEGKALFGEGSSLATTLAGSESLKILFQNGVTLEGDLVVTINKVVLNAKK